MVVFNNVRKEDLVKLKKEGFLEEETKSIYEEVRLRKEGVVLILYNSGKLLLQGKSLEREKVARELKKKGFYPSIELTRFRREEGTIIGSDESLKGDTFGGLTVAGVKANAKERLKLKELGVADSKKLADKEILVMAGEIRKLVSCEVLSVFPEDYNQRVGKEGLTSLMNRLHKEVYEYLKPGVHVVDKYPGCAVGEIKEEKAEDKYVEVAAASVLARAAALKQLDGLSVKAGFPLPKGSSHVKLALHEAKERGLDFSKFVKVHFKNVTEFL
ncbi:hypothetical protein HOC13_04845 [Candidatus Woesearchaeota archaeon]|nr:hypothetical protein [Candidatus Woesearchaeota archaeon]